MTDAVVYLSRRNLLTLLSKLDRDRTQPGATERTITKLDNRHPKYPQSMPAIRVVAVEDADYYIDREPGQVHPSDTP